MNKLQSIDKTELSDYCISILAKHEIFYIADFIVENSERLMKILNLNAEQVTKIKTAIKRLYGPAIRNMGDLREEPFYLTHIGPLDDMLINCLSLSNKWIWEICGPSAVGKTQLALSLVANFVQLHHWEALYIDTKLDFSARRLKNILSARQLEPEVVAGCLQAIRVERVLSAMGVVEMLEALWREKQRGCDNDLQNIKLIVIDSLPSVWFLLKAETNRVAGQYLLSRLANIAYRLAEKHQVWIIFINLSVLPNFEPTTKEGIPGICEIEDEDNVSNTLLDDDGNDELCSTYRQVLGRFWSSKPHIRLSLEFLTDSNSDRLHPRRLIKILQDYNQTTASSCKVRLSEQGVV